MNANLLEKHNLKYGWLPVDMNTAAITGARVKLDKADRVAIVVVMGDSTSATDVSFYLKQHNAASAGTTKALEVSNPYYVKAAAATSFTKVTLSAVQASGDYDLTSTFANDEGIVVFEVLAEDLDVNNGFAWVSLNAEDSGAAKLASCVYILNNTRYAPAYSQAL